MSTFNDVRSRFAHQLNEANKKALGKLNEAAKGTLQDEANSPGSQHGNTILINHLIKNNKIEDYKRFASMYPNGQPSTMIVSFLSSLNPKESIELADALYSLKSPSELSTSLYSNKSSLFGRLFDCIPSRGLGRGEPLIAWLIKESSIQGGTESFDVLIGKDKYEVKDYSSQGNAAILAGVRSKVSNFEFWKELVDTLRRLDKLTGFSGKTKFDISLYFNNELVNTVNQLLSRQYTILSGECNLNDLSLFRKFYDEASKIENSLHGYTNVILRGPNVKPMELSIDLLDPTSITGDTVTFHIAKTDQTATYVLSELKRLKYVRSPKDLDADMLSAVNKIHEGLTYIVFRKDTINITTDFVPTAISISSLKFVERTIAQKGLVE
jgi:hypothetical protein